MQKEDRKKKEGEERGAGRVGLGQIKQIEKER